MPPKTIDPLPQTATRCRVLGIDNAGAEHIYDKRRERVVALDETGIEVQYQIDEMDQTLADWMLYVENRRGWAKRQWDGDELAKIMNDIFGGE